MKTKIILELGCNHQGSTTIAKQMIDVAALLGVWAVKFQKRDIESIPDHIKNQKRNINNSFGTTYYEHRAALELSIEKMRELSLYSRSKGIVPIVSCFDAASVHDMVEIFEYIKLPSQLLFDYDMLHAINQHKKIKTMASTGMHTIQEIRYKPCPHEVLFYCRSIYPCSLEDVSLSTFMYLRSFSEKNYGCDIGYSSHDKRGEAIPYFVVLGAKYIERHFTLDKTMKGSDHSTVSSEPDEIIKIQEIIGLAERMKGDVLYNRLSVAEEKTRKVYRGV